MAPGEVLSVVAQVAVTLAGFAGIVVVFRPGGLHEWSAVERFRLRLLLINSAMPLLLALLGILLLTIEPPVAGIWRWASGVAFVAQVAFGVMTRRTAKLFRSGSCRSFERDPLLLDGRSGNGGDCAAVAQRFVARTILAAVCRDVRAFARGGAPVRPHDPLPSAREIGRRWKAEDRGSPRRIRPSADQGSEVGSRFAKS